MLDHERFVGYTVKKITVVRDYEHAFAVVYKKAFQPCQRFDVKVVGGLVQQKYVGLARELAAERKAGALTAAECAKRLTRCGGVKAHFFKYGRATSAKFKSALTYKTVVERAVFAAERLKSCGGVFSRHFGFQRREAFFEGDEVVKSSVHDLQRALAVVIRYRHRAVLTQYADAFVL